MSAFSDCFEHSSPRERLIAAFVEHPQKRCRQEGVPSSCSSEHRSEEVLEQPIKFIRIHTATYKFAPILTLT